jgi:Beta-lactamase
VPDPETICCLGSCTKAFTAVALVLLAQQGRIRPLPTPHHCINPCRILITRDRSLDGWLLEWIPGLQNVSRGLGQRER